MVLLPGGKTNFVGIKPSGIMDLDCLINYNKVQNNI